MRTPFQAYLRVDFGISTSVRCVVAYSMDTGFPKPYWQTPDWTLQTCDDPANAVTIATVDTLDVTVVGGPRGAIIYWVISVCSTIRRE